MSHFSSRERLDEKIELGVTSASKLPYPNASTDVVLLLAVLTCIIDPASEEAALLEVDRVLKPGGLLIVNDFLLHTELAAYDLKADRHGQYGVFRVDDAGQVKHMSKHRLSSILRNFRIEEFNEQPFVTMNGTMANGAIVVARK